MYELEVLTRNTRASVVGQATSRQGCEPDRANGQNDIVSQRMVPYRDLGLFPHTSIVQNTTQINNVL